MKRNPVMLLFALVLSLFYGIIAASQILGIARLYKPFLVILLALIMGGMVFYLFFRLGKPFNDSLIKPSKFPGNLWLTSAFLISGLALYVLLVFFPLAHWPYSPISSILPWDAGLYHFPKAVEMISTGSAWDLSISYGEYPFGYESLIAFALSLNHPGFLIGTIHALISLFLLLAMLLLVKRYTRYPLAPVILFVSLLFLGYQMARDFDSNIWWIFWPQVTLIGKNDLFLGASLLVVILFIPISREGPFFPFGLALASAVAISIKPNAGLIILVAWLLMLFFIWRSSQFSRYMWQLAGCVVTIFPGILWIFRNLIGQGRLISQASLTISKWSIASNLTNPFFYKYIPQHLYYIFGIIAVAAVFSIFRPALRFYCLLVLVLLITFALTPASAFFGSNQVRAEIAWRFAIALLAYIFVLLLVLFEPSIIPVYAWISGKVFLAIPLSIGVLVFGAWGVWSQRDLMSTYPQNAIVLHDQFLKPVGVDGYYSAYDYVQKNVHNSVVIVENGLPFYLYDSGFTNSVTRSRPADYIVYIKRSGGFPKSLDQPSWLKVWQLVYMDSEGRVYKRKLEAFQPSPGSY
jgi:hypothetical protein